MERWNCHKIVDLLSIMLKLWVNPVTLELNPSEQRSLRRLFTGDFKF